VSKFFKRTQKVNETPALRAPEPIDVSNVDQLLDRINRSVDDQLAGLDITVPAESKVASALEVAQDGLSVGVAEFPTETYRAVRLPRGSPRLFFPEDETVPAPPALEAYRSFRTRVLRLQARRQFRTVAVTSAAKGDGKTLTSINLALCCAQLPQYPVLLIDGDLRTHGSGHCLGHDEGPGLADVLSGRVARQAAVVATDVPNLHFVCAGDATKNPPELFSGTAWKEFMSWCRDNFKLVFVDCPPAFPLADFELISASCEGILVIARARATNKEALERVLAQVDTHKLLGVSLNSVASYDHSYYYYEYGDGKRRRR
jgi:capsular exopolysaccharide synthesis family protein